jgi:hypothetical protein
MAGFITRFPRRRSPASRESGAWIGPNHEKAYHVDIRRGMITRLNCRFMHGAAVSLIIPLHSFAVMAKPAAAPAEGRVFLARQRPRHNIIKRSTLGRQGA